MGVKEIIAKIEAEGNKEIAKIKEHYKHRVDELKKSQDKEKEKFYDVEMEKIKHEASEVKRGIILSAKLEKRKAILRAKRNSINAVFSKVEKDIKKLAGDDYYNFIKSNISEYAEDGDVILLSAGDVKDYEKKLKSDSKKKIEIKEGKLISGLIIERGSINLNISLEALINKKMEELENQVGKELNVL